MAFLRPTTLILGAGASHHYRFPLGRGLRDTVCAGLTNGELRGNLSALDHGYEEIQSFLDELQHSGYTSVDVFLEHNTEFIPIGRRAIAASLLPLENPQNLFPPRVTSEGHWYEYLIDRMGIGTEEWRSNELSVLTFNYDRSFEHYFTTVIGNRMGLSPAEAVEEFQRIPFVHLHGSLGGSPPGVAGAMPYGIDLTPDNIRRAADEILVIPQVISALPTFGEAEEILRRSQRIYFLGFGFLPENVRRLRIFEDLPSDEKDRPYIGGTSMGFSEGEWKEVLDGPLNGAWDDGRHQDAPYGFFRHFAKWD